MEIFNTGSRRALEKAGFTLEATLKRNVIKNGIIKDSCIYSILKEDFKYYISS
ncbi:MAG: GNAT family protein [Bacteroidia bacterium]|nr:GNAT family protein [Bacteroidia bacterium]